MREEEREEVCVRSGEWVGVELCGKVKWGFGCGGLCVLLHLACLLSSYVLEK